MRMKVTTTIALSLAGACMSVPALAQSAASAPRAPASAMADVREHWRAMSGFVLRSAMQVPEAQYGYRPIKGVRSFGEIFLHVAGAQSMFCAMALGEKPPAEDAVKATGKAAIIDALRQSTTDCERAYGQGDAEAAASIDVFGASHTRLYALTMNAMHNAEHYGNLVTYLRMTGMVPPSSQPTP